MRFNANKCYIMSINSKSTCFYQLDGHILHQVLGNPYICSTISYDLKYSSHISNITMRSTLPLVSSSETKNYALWTAGWRLTFDVSLIRSALEYSAVIWDPYLQKDIDKFEKKIQRRAARLISLVYSSMDHGCYTDADRTTSSTTARQKGDKPFGILLQGGEGGWCWHCRPMTIWHQSLVNAKLNLGNLRPWYL